MLMGTPQDEALRVFVSYSHKDAKLKEKLLDHLQVIVRLGKVEVWTDDQIAGGDEWRLAIDTAMGNSHVALLLISAGFLSSCFINDVEVPTILERRKQEGLVVIPVILKTCGWKHHPYLSHLQALPKEGKPIGSYKGDRREEAFTEICNEIARRAQGHTAQPEKPPTTAPRNKPAQQSFSIFLEHPSKSSAISLAPSARIEEPKPVSSKRAITTPQEHEFISEQLHATFFPIRKLPRYVYSARLVNAQLEEGALKDQSVHIIGHRPPAFIIREQKLFAFHELAYRAGPFSHWVLPETSQRLNAREMWDDTNQYRYYVALLNRFLRKFMGGRGLFLEVEHNRYFFTPGEDGADVRKSYIPLNKENSSRFVAWRPLIKATGEKRKNWEHLAISLQFHRIDDEAWILSLCPQRHFTQDGRTPLYGKTKGRRATKRNARLYNFSMLEDANFWRSYLADGKPRIIHEFGKQKLILEAQLDTVSITWPGVSDDMKSYANAHIEDDLWSHQELVSALANDDSDEDDEVELEGEDELPSISAG